MDIYLEPTYKADPVRIRVEGRPVPPYAWWFHMNGVIEALHVEEIMDHGRYDTDGQWLPEEKNRGEYGDSLAANVNIQIHEDNYTPMPSVGTNMAIRQIWPMGLVVCGDVLFTLWWMDAGSDEDVGYYGGHWDWRALRALEVSPRHLWDRNSLSIPARIDDISAMECMLLPVTPWASQWMLAADWSSHDAHTGILYHRGAGPPVRERTEYDSNLRKMMMELDRRRDGITYSGLAALNRAYGGSVHGSGERGLDRVDSVDDDTLRGILESLGIGRPVAKPANNILEPEEYQELQAPVRMVESMVYPPTVPEVSWALPEMGTRYNIPLFAFCQLYMRRSGTLIVPTSSMMIEHWSASRIHLRLESDLGLHYLHCTARILAVEAIGDIGQLTRMTNLVYESRDLVIQDCVLVSLRLQDNLGMAETHSPVRDASIA
jgi:hypothetical protein